MASTQVTILFPAYRFEVSDEITPQDLLRKAADRHWLPSIQGNRATWVIVSNELLAVLSYEWSDLHFLSSLGHLMRVADLRDGVLWLHFNYLAQIEADVVKRVFWGLTLRSPRDSNLEFWEGKGPGYDLLQKK